MSNLTPSAATCESTSGETLASCRVPSCGVCGSPNVVATVQRERLPAMQNYVYRTRDAAVKAKVGQLSLDVCQACGFAFNGRFRPELLDYDQGYDNTVPSLVMAEYYESLATELHAKYFPHGGLLLDIGCGKGMFLETMCRLFPDVEGLGIDPAYEGPEQIADGRVKFIAECFAAHHIDRRPNLVICRHVIEHMNPPPGFLKALHSATHAYPDVPFFIEVPDLTWILKHETFWDFCYEHCNYFTPASLSNAMTLSGFRTVGTRPAFGDQYIWLEAVTQSEVPAALPPQPAVSTFVSQVQSYAKVERQLVDQARVRLAQLKSEKYTIALWGMSTKGVLFSFLVDPERGLIDHCIDINPNKQGCFVPVTGHAIIAAKDLPKDASRPLAVFVMNTNYLAEVAETCRSLGHEPLFLNAAGDTLTPPIKTE